MIQVTLAELTSATASHIRVLGLCHWPLSDIYIGKVGRHQSSLRKDVGSVQ